MYICSVWYNKNFKNRIIEYINSNIKNLKTMNLLLTTKFDLSTALHYEQFK